MQKEECGIKKKTKAPPLSAQTPSGQQEENKLFAPGVDPLLLYNVALVSCYISAFKQQAAKNTINFMNYTYFGTTGWALLTSGFLPHGVITEVTTAVMNTAKWQIETHTAHLLPQRNSDCMMTEVAYSDKAVWTRGFTPRHKLTVPVKLVCRASG